MSVLPAGCCTAKFYVISQFYIPAAGGGQLPDVLQEAQIQVLELADCQERYSSTPYQVYDESICVFKLTDGDDHTGSCYVSIQTLAMARPSVGLESYVSAQTLAISHPSVGLEPAVVLTVTARKKKPGLIYVILKRIGPIKSYSQQGKNSTLYNVSRKDNDCFWYFLDIQNIIDKKSNYLFSRQS